MIPELEEAISHRVVELVDALHAPAGQFAQRARAALESFAREAVELSEQFDDAKTDPRGRVRNPTMELRIDELIWDR